MHVNSFKPRDGIGIRKNGAGNDTHLGSYQHLWYSITQDYTVGVCGNVHACIHVCVCARARVCVCVCVCGEKEWYCCGSVF